MKHKTHKTHRRHHMTGSRRQVWNGTAKHTPGGLTKSDLLMNQGRIVSKKKHFSAKKENRLVKYGYGTKKGHFGFVKTKSHRGGSHHALHHGGSGLLQLNPASLKDLGVNGAGGISGAEEISGAGVTNFPQFGSLGPQLRAGMSGGRHRKSPHRRHHRRHRGGSALTPASLKDLGGISGAGVTNFPQFGSLGQQLRAGMSGGRHRGGRHHRGGTTKRSV